jgi:ornithine cyclodeaminase
MKVVTLAEMLPALDAEELYRAIEQAFIAYSAGKAVVPPVGELTFERPPGDVHIKYGYIKEQEHYVIKVASSFYDNPKRGLPSSDGLMLVARVDTGQLEALLLDGGHLTNVRTAIAGALAAKALANPRPKRIGIVGTGIQARLQLRYHLPVTGCRDAIVWGRTPAACAEYKEDMENEGFRVEIAPDLASLAAAADLIVTTTPSTKALLFAEHAHPGLHVTAVGADTAEKRELDPGLLAKADLVVCDSRSQCAERGDCARALDVTTLPELGEVLAGTAPGRRRREDVTICDLTGVAVQDVAIASFVLGRL